jgi:hypothetical protein
MARFTVRIELHDATREKYTKLHEQIFLQGFTDFIEIEDGTYQLPPAEYNFEGNIGRDDVLKKAKTAASSVVKKYAVLVTESTGRTWYGLEKN